MSKIKVYVAGSWKNRLTIKRLMEYIEEWGNIVIIDWTKHQEKGDAKQYAKEDLKGLKDCDCLIYCMDSNHSRGKNFELGYITALDKPVVIYIISDEKIDAYLDMRKIPIDSLVDKECIFVRARLYPIIGSLDDLRLWIENLEVKLLLSRVRKKQMEENAEDGRECRRA